MTRAAVYTRISQDSRGEGLGVARQREDCLELAATLGWEVARVYTDNDISATSGKVRPEYQQMLRDITAGDIEAIVVWSPDRLYRRAADLETLIPVLEAKGVLVRTVKAGDIDLSSAYGRMIARILGAIATGEGEVKAERWKRSWRQGREAGAFPKTGSRLFGYTRDGELIPAEADIARRMAKDVLSGVPIQAVARWLVNEGITSTRGGVWRPAAIRQYLTNPVVTGYSTLKGEIVGEGTWEPVLDRDTWETVRALLESRTRERPPRVAVLAGYIYCGNCGHRLITGSARGKRRYICPSPVRPGMNGCGTVSVDSGYVEEIVEAYARERLSDPAILARAAELRSGDGGRELLAEISGLEARLVELDDQLAQPGVPVDRLMRAYDRTKERLEDCHKQLATLARRGVPTAYAGGMDWPEDLAQRRQLVEVALAGQKVYVDLLTKGANRFDPSRVRIDP